MIRTGVRPFVRAQEEGWVTQAQHSDAVLADATALEKDCQGEDKTRVDEHLSGIRDLERAIAGLPPEYRHIDRRFRGDMKDWPRIAKLQSDLPRRAFCDHQTRVASYMLTKCQSHYGFPGWVHVRTATTITRMRKKDRGADGVEGQRVLRDICGGMWKSLLLMRSWSLCGRRWQPVRPHQSDLRA